MQVSTQHQVLHNAGDQMSEEALSTATLMMDITVPTLPVPTLSRQHMLPLPQYAGSSTLPARVLSALLCPALPCLASLR